MNNAIERKGLVVPYEKVHTTVVMWFHFSAHSLLLWRETRIQVFQDDVRERKEEGGKDIVDLHRSLIHNFLAPVCSPSFFLWSNAQFAELD